MNKNPAFISPGYWDAGGTPDDPADDVWISGDYHLKAVSPCIDAGLLASKMYLPGGWSIQTFGPEGDFEGDPRTDDWNTGEISGISEKYCEMGADEFTLLAIPWQLLLLLDE